MNRQQRRAKDRQREKDINKMIKQRKSMPLNAAEKKKLRAVEWTMSLSKEEKELLMEFCNENSKRELNDAYYGLDTVLSVHLNDDIGLITKIYNDLNIEGNKTKEYAAKGESYMKKIEENRNNIIEDYKKLKEEGKKENEIIKDIVFKYNITNNAAKNVISQYKKELKEKEEKSKIEEIVDYIWEEDKKEEVKEPVKEEPIKEVEEDPKDSPKGKYEILEEKIIIKRTIKGDYGTYKIDNGVMEVEGCGFTNKEDIEELYNNRLIKLQSEIKRLMRETQEVEKNKTEALEIMEIYMA